MAKDTPDTIKRRTKKMHKFLEAYREDGTVYHAAKIAGISRDTVYTWRKDHPEFAAEMEQAREDSIESLERIARERAAQKSDVLLIFLLKAARPDVYADRQQIKQEGTLRVDVAGARERLDGLLSGIAAAEEASGAAESSD